MPWFAHSIPAAILQSSPAHRLKKTAGGKKSSRLRNISISMSTRNRSRREWTSRERIRSSAETSSPRSSRWPIRWQEVIALAEHLNIHVYQEPIAPRVDFPRTHPLFRGNLFPAQQPLADQLAAHDTVVVLGAPIFLYYAYVPDTPISPGTKLFQITNSPLDASAALAGTSIVGNLASAMKYIRSHAAARKRNSVSPQPPPLEPKPEYPITPGFLFSVLNRVMPRDAVVCEECPSSKGDLDRNIRLDQPGSF